MPHAVVPATIVSALKVPHAVVPVTIVSAPVGYKIPKKADPSVISSKLVSKHLKKSSGKHSKKSKKDKKHSKKPKKYGKPKKDSPSQDSSTPPPSESSSSDVEAPKIDEETAQVLCSVCCKYTAQPAFAQLGGPRAPSEGAVALLLTMLGILKPGPGLGHILVERITFCNPHSCSYALLERQGGL